MLKRKGRTPLVRQKHKVAKPTQTSVDDLPSEILLFLFRMLRGHDCLHFALTQKVWYKLVSTDKNDLHRALEESFLPCSLDMDLLASVWYNSDVIFYDNPFCTLKDMTQVLQKILNIATEYGGFVTGRLIEVAFRNRFRNNSDLSDYYVSNLPLVINNEPVNQNMRSKSLKDFTMHTPTIVPLMLVLFEKDAFHVIEKLFGKTLPSVIKDALEKTTKQLTSTLDCVPCGFTFFNVNDDEIQWTIEVIHPKKTVSKMYDLFRQFFSGCMLGSSAIGHDGSRFLCSPTTLRMGSYHKRVRTNLLEHYRHEPIFHCNNSMRHEINAYGHRFDPVAYRKKADLITCELQMIIYLWHININFMDGLDVEQQIGQLADCFSILDMRGIEKCRVPHELKAHCHWKQLSMVKISGCDRFSIPICNKLFDRLTQKENVLLV